MIALALIWTLAAPPPVTFVTVVGQVEVDSGTAKTPARAFDPVAAGSTIITHRDSMATLRMPSGTELRLGAETTLTLGQLDQRKPAGRRSTRFRLAIGKIWAGVSALFGNDASFEVETPNAVAGIRGTAFWIESNATADTFVVDEGTIELTRAGQLLSLKGRGAAVQTAPDGFAKPHQVSPAELTSLRRRTGGPAGFLLDTIRHMAWGDQPLPPTGRPVDATLNGPDAPINSAVTLSPPETQLRGRAIVNLEVRLPVTP